MVAAHSHCCYCFYGTMNVAFDDYCDNQQPRCTYLDEVRRLVTFEASPSPQSKHPVGSVQQTIARERWKHSCFFSARVMKKDDFHTLINSFKTSSSLWSITCFYHRMAQGCIVSTARPTKAPWVVNGSSSSNPKLTCHKRNGNQS